VRDDGGVLAVVEGPQLAPGARVEPVRVAVERREVDDAVDDRRRAGDLARRLEPPDDRSCRGVEAIEPLAVGAGVDALSPHGRRGVDVAARTGCPLEVTARRAEGIDLAVR